LESHLYNTFLNGESYFYKRGKHFCLIKMFFKKGHFSKELLKLSQIKFRFPFEIILFS
jgi:hypothetical protein